MPELSVGVRSESGDLPYFARYTGEQFPMVITFHDKSDNSSLDVTDAALEMELGSIHKTNNDFTNPYQGQNNRAKVLIKENDTSSSGTFRGQVKAIFSGRDEIVKTDPITLILLSGTAVVTMAEIRMFLQDLSTENDLWDDQEISDGILALARKEALDEWNSQPGQTKRFDESNFPEKWSLPWLKGSAGYALLMKARNLAGNQLAYSAGGLSVDTKGPRIETYTQLGQLYRQEWLEFVRGQQYHDTILNSFRTITRW